MQAPLTLEFKAFPKIPRLNREMVITEKIDGANACVVITETGQVGAQSRNRPITPESDNFGFAQWVQDNADALRDTLGPGYHYGEWWGKGIQRGYGLDHRRFSLFNVTRWDARIAGDVDGLGVVPLLYRGEFDHHVIEDEVSELRLCGSVAAHGQPAEGVVVYLPAANQLFKVTCHDDHSPKGALTV